MEPEGEFTERLVVGVGPYPEPWPTGPRYDPDLLAEGDRRNVGDRYRYWTREAIVADLDTRRHPFHVAIENWQHDFNIGSVVRTANAFLAAEVHIVGRRRWNRRGAMVTDRYQHVRHHASAPELAAWAAERGLPLLGIDNLPGAVPLETYPLPRECVLLFGQEGPGLSPDAHAASAAVLSIAQFGSTRSINAGAAAAVAMHAWVRAHVFDQPVSDSSEGGTSERDKRTDYTVSDSSEGGTSERDKRTDYTVSDSSEGGTSERDKRTIGTVGEG